MCFRSTEALKQIFWSLDHQTDDEIIERAYPAITAAGANVSSHNVRQEFVQDYRRAKLELIAQVPNLAKYELMSKDQAPDQNLSLAAWLVRNQVKALGTERMVFMDFEAPIEFEALMLPDAVM